MRPQGTAELLEGRRRLAVRLRSEGMDPADVADVVQSTERSVRRWRAADRDGGDRGLAAVPQAGRPPKLSDRQAAEVVSWVRRSPSEFGFATERWTAPRVAEVIARAFGVGMNHRYLNDWLARRGVTPQVPQCRAAERDEAAVARWVRRDWPRVKKTPGSCTPRSGSPTSAGSCCSPWSGRRWPRAGGRRSSDTAHATGTRSRRPRP